MTHRRSVELRREIRLAKHRTGRVGRRRRRKPSSTRKSASTSSSAPSRSPDKSNQSLLDWFTPKNIQDSLKTVGNLHGTVRNWLGYLQRADRVLETLSVMSTNLKESGVLDKIVQQRGKNLSTDDFTNILMALMNSPAGSQVFKSMGNKDENTSSIASE